MLITPDTFPADLVTCASQADAKIYFIGLGITAGIMAIILLFLKSRMNKVVFYALFVVMALVCLLYSFNFDFYRCQEAERIFRLLPEKPPFLLGIF